MTTGQTLFRRQVKVTVDTLQITDLAMQFSVKRTLKPSPNTCDLKIFNLNPDHRSQIEQKKTATVQIEAGYASGTSVIFLGDLRTSLSVWQGPDCVTSLSCGDGEKAVQTSRVNKSFKKQTKTADILKAIAQALGVGQGNLNDAVAKLSASGIGDIFSQGTVLTGSAAREMTNICRSAGLSWSIQNGKLQILGARQSLAGTAIQVTETSGLIGSPTVDNKGIVSVRSLMLPDVFPGRLMVLQSDRIKGQYRIEECEWAGDTHGTDWYLDMKGKRY